MKMFALTLTAVGLILASPAFASGDVSSSSTMSMEKSADGDMTKKSTETSVDAAGTKETTKSEVKVDADKNGDVTTETKTETKTDPKGLGNEVKAEETKKEEVKANGDYKGEATSESKDNAGATDKETVKAEVKTDKDGLKTKKVKHKKVHDPKGLGNKTTETTTDTTTQKADGTVEEKHETEVNGTTTEKTDVTH
jgi:hypothetical protein